MRRIAAGLAVWLGGVAESAADCLFGHRNQRTERACHA
jgi:hypothetical protein